MYCPRLDHFVRINSNGSISRCGHMVDPPQFNSLNNMETSEWLQSIKQQFKQEVWPAECRRCQETEDKTGKSIRLNSIRQNQNQNETYLQVGGVLDNLCNAGCLTCNASHSTRIGSLAGRDITIVDNSNHFWSLPQSRIEHLDISGGEPSYSKNYKRLLENLPPNLKTLRLNTNGATVLSELTEVANKGIEVTVTLSIDGVDDVYEFVRWPLIWKNFYNNLMTYKSMPVKLNLWTTVSVLNVNDLPNIIEFARQHQIDHSYAYLKTPVELDVNNKNQEQVREYIQKQKQLRGIV